MRMYFWCILTYCTNVVATLLQQTRLLANCNTLELHLKLTLSWVNLSGVKNERRYLLVILRKPWFVSFCFFYISFVNQHPLFDEIADSSKLLECQEQWLQLWMVWHGHASSNTLRRWGPFDQSVLYSRTPKDIIFFGSTIFFCFSSMPKFNCKLFILWRSTGQQGTSQQPYRSYRFATDGVKCWLILSPVISLYRFWFLFNLLGRQFNFTIIFFRWVENSN